MISDNFYWQIFFYPKSGKLWVNSADGSIFHDFFLMIDEDQDSQHVRYIAGWLLTCGQMIHGIENFRKVAHELPEADDDDDLS